MAESDQLSWYGVRCVYRYPGAGAQNNVLEENPDVFEERITIWQATSFDHAIAKAEEEGHDYASNLECERTDLVQAYSIDDEIQEGTEVFSLMRDSALPSSAYLDRYFDDGNERQGTTK